MAENDFYKTDLAHIGGDFVRTPTGDLDTISGVENVRQALYQRLLTTPGSLIHRPNYGVGIKNFQNALADSSQKIKLANIITEQFERDSRVNKVLSMVVISGADPSQFKIKVGVDLLGYGEVFFTFGIGDTIDGT